MWTISTISATTREKQNYVQKEKGACSLCRSAERGSAGGAKTTCKPWQSINAGGVKTSRTKGREERRKNRWCSQGLEREQTDGTGGQAGGWGGWGRGVGWGQPGCLCTCRCMGAALLACTGMNGGGTMGGGGGVGAGEQGPVPGFGAPGAWRTRWQAVRCGAVRFCVVNAANKRHRIQSDAGGSGMCARWGAARGEEMRRVLPRDAGAAMEGQRRRRAGVWGQR